MKAFTPIIKKVEPSIVPASRPSVYSSMAELRQDCQLKVMAGTGPDRVHNGEYFLSALTPKLFIANLEETELFAPKQMFANFDNTADSAGIDAAIQLSEEYLSTGSVQDYQFYFKLVDSVTKETIASDRPDYEERESTEVDELPDFLKVAPTRDSIYVPDENVCAWLMIYIQHDGRPTLIARANIESKFSGELNVVRNAVANGHHIQAGVAPKAKVARYFAGQPEAKGFTPETAVA